MNNILVFSDIHISNHKNSLNRLEDCLKTLEWVFKVANERNIKNIIFAGDLFQDRQKLNVLAYQKTFEILESNQGTHIHILIGNHDMWFHESHEISSVIPLRALSNVSIIDKPCTLNIQGKDIDFLPYTKDPKSDIEEYFKAKSDILFGHLSIDGAYLNMYYGTTAEVSVEHEGEMYKVDAGVFNGWKKVLLGHFHGAQKINDIVEYIGSPLELSFNEAFQQKHVIVLDLDTLGQEYIINNFSPKHLIVQENELDNFQLKNNFVRIMTEDLNSSKIMEMKNALVDLGSLEFKESKNNTKAEIKTDLENAKKILSEGEIVEKYLSIIETKLDKEKLARIGRSIIQKASAE